MKRKRVKLQFIDLFVVTDITSLKGHKVLFQDCQDASPSVQVDCTPYINIGCMVKECHHGPEEQRKAKERRKQKPVTKIICLKFKILIPKCIISGK